MVGGPPIQNNISNVNVPDEIANKVKAFGVVVNVSGDISDVSRDISDVTGVTGDIIMI